MSTMGVAFRQTRTFPSGYGNRFYRLPVYKKDQTLLFRHWGKSARVKWSAKNGFQSSGVVMGTKGVFPSGFSVVRECCRGSSTWACFKNQQTRLVLPVSGQRTATKAVVRYRVDGPNCGGVYVSLPGSEVRRAY